jgi:hypothetical protein
MKEKEKKYVLKVRIKDDGSVVGKKFLEIAVASGWVQFYFVF